MLSRLFHNSTVLVANGPYGSYRAAKSSRFRQNSFNELEVAFKLARAAGIVRNKYFEIEGKSINFKIGENLIKIKKVAAALEELRTEGLVTKISGGKIFFPQFQADSDKRITKKEVVDALFSKLKGIRGYGQIDEGEARKNLEKKTIWKILIPEGKQGLLSDATHFLGTWGLYSYFLSRISIEAAAGRILYDHKKTEAEKISSTYPKSRTDALRTLAKKEAEGKDMEEIKFDLQADNPADLPALDPPDGQELPDYDFVISDVHLREFHHENTDNILRFIWMVKKLNGRLIINGDFFDVWRSGGLDRAWINNTRIVNALTKLKEVILVVGNHDEFLAKLARRGGIFINPKIKVVEEYISKDRHLKIFHGHQFDKFNRPGSWIGRLVTRMVTRMEMSLLRKTLEAVSRVTLGTFSSFSRFLGFIFGHHLSSRLLLIPKLILPTSYVLNRKAKNIMEWLWSEIELSYLMDNLLPNAQDPLVFVIGHIHFEGLSYLTEMIKEAINKRYGDSVKLVITDSWEGGEGYIGDYVSITQAEAEVEQGAARSIIRKEIW